MRVFTIVAISLFSIVVQAESYQTFISANHMVFDEDREINGINIRHFFDERETMGPLNEFEYIDRISNVSGLYNTSDYSDQTIIGGDLYIGPLSIGGSFSRYDSKIWDYSNDSQSVNIGYFITDDFVVRAGVRDGDGIDEAYNFSAQYNYKINDSDYLGFSFYSDDEFEYRMLSSKYFNSLGDDRYLSFEIDYSETDSYNDWRATGTYYFNKKTSFAASYAEESEFYNLRFNHFINDNISVNANYGSDVDGEFDTYGVGVSLQF